MTSEWCGVMCALERPENDGVRLGGLRLGFGVEEVGLSFGGELGDEVVHFGEQVGGGLFGSGCWLVGSCGGGCFGKGFCGDLFCLFFGIGDDGAAFCPCHDVGYIELGFADVFFGGWYIAELSNVYV